MADDHGTLRDDHGNPKVYLAIAEGDRPSVPLNESQVWPEHLLTVNVFRGGRITQEPPKPGQRCSAEYFAAHVEARTTSLLGGIDCPGGEGAHAEWWMPTAGCPWCGAVR